MHSKETGKTTILKEKQKLINRNCPLKKKKKKADGKLNKQRH